MKPLKIHWGGGSEKHATNLPVCCRGYRAELIKAKKRITSKVQEVTCEKCLIIIGPQLTKEERGTINMFGDQSGSKNPASKLTWEIVRSIRDDYKKGCATQKNLSEKYNVSPSTIGKILRRESWVEGI